MAAIPYRMTAIEIAAPGGPDVLRAVERPVPQPSTGEVLVRVEAAGVNRPDVLQRLRAYPPPPGASDIPGLETAGTTALAHFAAKRWHPGRPIFELVVGRRYADYCAGPP